MDWTESNHRLRFERPRRAMNYRLISMLLALAFFALFWVVVPIETAYWLLLPILAVLVWIASYGWRQALSAVIVFLTRLQHL